MPRHKISDKACQVCHQNKATKQVWNERRTKRMWKCETCLTKTTKIRKKKQEVYDESDFEPETVTVSDLRDIL